jgi:hypothetical protein
MALDLDSIFNVIVEIEREESEIMVATPNINQLTPITGRQIKENGNTANVADMLEAIYNGLIVNKDAGLKLTGSSASIETAIIKGTATSGSTTQLIDTTKNFEADLLIGKTVKITIGNADYLRKITGCLVDMFGFQSIQEGAAASAVIGLEDTAEVTVVCAEAGEAGNLYTVQAIAAPGTDDNLSASLADGVITVYLGKTAGELDPAKNTATAVAEAIDQIPEFTATMTGSGGAFPLVEPTAFSGGVDAIVVTDGTPYEIFAQPTGVVDAQLTGSRASVKILDLASLAGGATSAISTGFDCPVNPSGQVSVSGIVTFPATHTGGCTFFVYGSYDGTNFDTEPLTAFNVASVVGQTARKSVILNVGGLAKIAIKAKNEDGSNAFGAVLAYGNRID